ncbi:hypothetical protein LEM8419_02439 [Neolewinella maritima]|uniref:TM2 domain-containing protein n=1 Tax=Neolewinella maritima TaxID=1383882 RepID=A0ABM9B2F8_9BACT|nr:NINE protein [Neolewinella maritima]CAH1001536.1 hypothetical protein LEM8419_02439 [Neolewinella maritima]
MKDKTTAGILALIFGGLGVHRFYLGQVGRGLLYLFFIWTFIPTIISMIDGIIFLTQSEDKFDRKYNPAEYYASLQRQQAQQQVIYVAPVVPPPATKHVVRTPEPKLDPFRVSGDRKYQQYDFDGAMEDYRKSLNVDPRQGEVHYKLAALHSIHEDTAAALRHLSLALEHGFYDFDAIEQNDHLAYLRSTPEFHAFKSNGYRMPPVASAPPVTPPTEEQPAETLELSDDLITRIERLARLKDDGILTEESFEREKVKILRS